MYNVPVNGIQFASAGSGKDRICAVPVNAVLLVRGRARVYRRAILKLLQLRTPWGV